MGISPRPSMSRTSPRFSGFLCNARAEIAWDEGAKPTLIKEEWAQVAELRDLEKRAGAMGMRLAPQD